MTQLHTSPASIAAALRRAADDLDKAGDVQLAAVNLRLNLQAVSYEGTADERKATVDALCVALAGAVGHTETCDDPHHRISFQDSWGARDDMDLAIYTSIAGSPIGGEK